MPQLLPFPRYYHLPPGITEALPVTRNGIRGLHPFPFVATEGARWPVLSVRNGESGHQITAICGLLPASAFHDGTVLPHERTLSARLERQQRMVTADRGALGKPVLLTVPTLGTLEPPKSLDDSDRQVIFYGENHIYRLSASPVALRRPVALPGPLVIADGHHRAYTHAALAADGLKEFQYIPVVVAGADRLTIGTFLRVIDVQDREPEALLAELGKHFFCERLDRPRLVASSGQWLYSYRGVHYHLTRRDTSVSDTDPGWLNQVVLPEVFGITDTRTDRRFESLDPPAVLAGEVYFSPDHHGRAKFLGKPITRDRFFSEVQAGKTLPPKSTRFEPRVPSGLLVWIPE
ncbi:uncharacterized protein (DUF1015 family) [Neolewinella xylanilytica]|uniref:Uncharacterized protein (DUF1015 family) n=1 Tax=Neolewinella xylanilytica TaxID=1514080 RepID=A0A2S6IAQ5_9BACT|nr:DUF1015 family protein [Neolewinella xylanilytica]PPK88539.1 uncharacterized protein (DUF1015 family) [Neolewinella xylanilytica]